MKINKTGITLFWLLIANFCTQAQTVQIDSLMQILNTAKEDTGRVNILIDLSMRFRTVNPDTAIILGNEALAVSEKIKWPNGKGKSYLQLGILKWQKSDYSQSLDYYLKSLDVWNSMEQKADGNAAYIAKMKSKTLGNIGIVYSIQSNYPKALQYMLKALKISEAAGDDKQTVYSLNSIGVIYKNIQDYPKALLYYLKALKINENSGNRGLQAINLGNIAIIYREQKNYSKALENSIKGLKIAEELGDKTAQEYNLGIIGNTYNYQGSYSLALEYYFKALQKDEELGNKSGICRQQGNIGSTYTKMKRYKEAEDYLQKALKTSLALGELETKQQMFQNLKELYEDQKDYLKAYDFYKKYILVSDSIKNKENIKRIVQQQMQYEFDKQQTADSLKVAEERKLNEVKFRQERTQRYSLYGGLALVIVFAGFMFNRFKVTQKQKQIIEIKEQETQKQKHLIEEKNKEITDSITYAKRLQEAILPPQEYIDHYLPDNFVLYKPKDLVAGDFYWMEHLDDITFIAAADSTGHGVPGAMVSVVCSNALNRAVKEFDLRETGMILDKTRELVLETFSKSNSEVKDGMDISLCSINSRTNEIYWSGANNPLWYIQNNELKEIKAHKQPIGRTDNPYPFPTHKLEVQKGDILYLITDGFADQFGGERGKKYKYKQLTELLLSTLNMTLQEQKQELEKSFENWKGTLEQVDDVTIIGIKV